MAKLEFVGYDGKWPCLCFGTLKIKAVTELVNNNVEWGCCGGCGK